MKRSLFFKLAASSLILGGTMAGCASTGPATRAFSASNGAAPAGAEKPAMGDKAVVAAEAAVAASPADASARAALGEAYMADGRFVSAEASFADAMTLGHADARTVIGLALARIANGRGVQAQALLADHMDVVPAADYGLAMALAGNPQEGLRVLSAEARQPDATPRVRQNLAYALALAGQWRESKLVASQDLSPADAAKRVGDWAVLARPGARAQQIAQLMGVTPQADPGLPVALALKDQGSAPVRMAAAQDAPVAQPSAPAEIDYSMEPVAAPAAPVRPAVKAVAAAAPVAIPASAPARAAESAPPRRAAARGASRYVVQLGAYSESDRVDLAWQRISSRFQNLGAYSTLSNVATVNGRTYHRLALSGFEDRHEAEKVCSALQAQGRPCFVRSIAGEEATRWVSLDSRQRAS